MANALEPGLGRPFLTVTEPLNATCGVEIVNQRGGTRHREGRWQAERTYETTGTTTIVQYLPSTPQAHAISQYPSCLRFGRKLSLLRGVHSAVLERVPKKGPICDADGVILSSYSSNDLIVLLKLVLTLQPNPNVAFTSIELEQEKRDEKGVAFLSTTRWFDIRRQTFTACTAAKRARQRFCPASMPTKKAYEELCLVATFASGVCTSHHWLSTTSSAAIAAGLY
ncbi:hypothetical protein BKA82DRAFT_7185 [Pisolithus tinctorius]|uniref:Uncharacterized protein n=1 Tax=Pisolithus tinctorius Marx 270 TaxID=870435 RepID=A0A0C3KQU9_PISTI|nr:hypothetical protein BKA82DRAFT_7185 [Pisolithus tinctorius]KIO11882.1 hypothetical protein M404DRAFT_7185 [Pisolithus tinctorius Marx 270]